MMRGVSDMGIRTLDKGRWGIQRAIVARHRTQGKTRWYGYGCPGTGACTKRLQVERSAGGCCKKAGVDFSTPELAPHTWERALVLRDYLTSISCVMPTGWPFKVTSTLYLPAGQSFVLVNSMLVVPASSALIAWVF